MKPLKSSMSVPRGIIGVIGLVWMSIACLSAGPLLLRLLSSGSLDPSGGIPNLIFIGVSPFILLSSFAVGLAMLVWAALPLVARMKAEPPRLTISNDRPRVGEEFTFAFEQSFRNAVDVNEARLTLVLCEKATYRSGTDRKTATHERVIMGRDLPARRYEAGESLVARHTLRIPEDAMHTFEGHNNKILWMIKLRVGLSGWPDVVEEYPITVLPERIN